MEPLGIEARSPRLQAGSMRTKAAVLLVLHDAAGRERTLAASVVDISAAGATIEAACRVEPETLAWVDFTDSGTTAIAHARECARRNGGFRIRFRFSSPMMRAPARAPGLRLVHSR